MDEHGEVEQGRTDHHWLIVVSQNCGGGVRVAQKVMQVPRAPSELDAKVIGLAVGDGGQRSQIRVGEQRGGTSGG
jgi:hypothetical protein